MNETTSVVVGEAVAGEELVGQHITCTYNGKQRWGTVEKVFNDGVLVKTSEGFRRFKWDRVEDFITIGN